MKQIPTFFLLVALILCSTVALAQPANDDCANATDITADLNSGTCATYAIGGATDDLEAGCNGNFCTGGPNGNPNENVWFSFTAPYSGTVKIIVNGYTWGSPNYDPIIAIFSACLPTAEIGCDDVDGDGINDDSTNTFTIPTLVGGTTYYISIDPPCDDTGSFCLQVDFFDPDHCNNGIMDVDETGIDCGGADCLPCHCFNNIQDFDETDIDCGGADCLQCMSCTDNGDCNSATPLTLTGTGDTLSICFADCNNGASTESWNFAGGCPNVTNTETVYYTFTTSEYYLDVFFNNTGITQPQLTLLTEDCSQYYEAGCVVGSGGAVSFTDFPAGTGNTYTLMITSQSGETDTFNLCIYNYPDLSDCAVDDTLIANPPPDTSGGNFQGGYPPGTTVEFCYDLNQYNKVDCQWISGFVPIIGSGWDISTFNVTLAPTSADGSGVWGWYSASTGNPITYNFNGTYYNTGDTVNPFGGWFYLQNCGPCPNHGGDPNLSWGDGQCGGPCQCDVDGSGFTWSLCFELTTPLTCFAGADLSVGIKTFADGEVGGHVEQGCDVDPITYPFWASPTSICSTCKIQNISVTNVLCNGDSTGSAIATMDTTGATPFTYSWNSTPAQTDSAATGLPGGTYTLNVTDAVGCTDSGSVTITEPSGLVTTITSSTMVSCFGDATGSATVSASGGVTPYTFLWDDGSAQTDSTATGLVAGAYEVMVTDSNGCMDSVTVLIAEPLAPLSATITASTDLVCNGVATGDITVTGAGGIIAYTYLWDDPSAQTNAMATGLLAGLYQVIITDAKACSDSDTITLTEPSALALVISAFSDANCGSSDGMATVTPSGGTGAYTYLWDDSSAQTDSVANGLSAASYQVVVTDGNGCQDSISQNINNLGGGTAAITDSTQVLCNGDSTGSLTVTPAGGSAPFTYLWDDPSAQTDSVANGIPAGTYTATVTDNAGCIALATSTITQPTAISLSIISIIDVACNSALTGTAVVNASGGVSPYSYLWDDPSNQTDSVANGIGAGTYQAVVTDNNGCVDSITATLTEPTALTVSITDAAMVGCNGDSTGSATATPTGGTSPYTYFWDDPSNQADSVAGGVPAGTYKVVITDANGCMDSITTVITEPAVLSLTTVADSTSCGGYSDGKTTVTVVGGTANFNYIWSSGDSTLNTAALIDSATGLTAGTYYVTVTDNNGCSAVDSTKVEQPVDITVGVAPDSAVGCNGDSTGVATAVLSFGVAPYNYMWSSGDTLLGATDTSNTVNGLAAGTYTVQVSDASGCISSDSVVITEPSLIDLSVTINNHVYCNGLSDGSARVNTKNTGTSPWDYIWSNGDSTMASSSSTNDVFALAAGTYYVTVTDANGCSAMDTAIITEPTLLTVTTTSVDAACGASDGSATATPSGGTGQYSYLWDDPGTQTTSTAIGLAANSYTVEVTDSNGCVATDVVNISNIGGASISVDSVVDLTCNGDSSGSISITVTGGSTPLTYLWSDSAATEEITGLDAGSYSVTVTDSMGCVAILDTLITEPAALVITTSSTDITCFGADDGDGTATVTGGASPYAYLWDDLLAQTSMSALGLAAGTFTVIVTDTAGCTATDSVTITEPAAIVVTASATDNCLGETSATATAMASGGSGSFTYSWDTSPVQTNATVTGLASGSYTATVVDGSSGCIETATATVNSIALPTIFAGDDETIALGSSVPLSATGGLSYNWTPSTGFDCDSCQHTEAAPTTTTEYIVFGTDANNCGNSDTITVFVDDKTSLYLPDIFSPNGDGENDYVFVQGKGIKVVEKFIIYDRWGIKVFENSNFDVLPGKYEIEVEANEQQGWDGKYKGALLNPGVFVYYVRVIFMDDSFQEENGDFTLVH